MLQQRRAVLVCPSCSERIALPSRSPEEKSQLQPYYWPTGEPSIAILCPLCDFLFAHPRQDVQLRTAEAEGPNPPPSVFWKVALTCDHENCGQRFSVHTRTEAGATKNDVGISVLRAKPALVCPAGHTVSNPQGLAVQKIPESGLTRDIPPR